MSDNQQTPGEAGPQDWLALRARLAELENREKKSRGLIEMTPDGVCVCNIKGDIIEVNERLCRMTGYREDELLQLTVADVDIQSTPERVQEHIVALKAQGTVRFETQNRCKDGTLIDVETLLHHIEDDQAFVIGFVRDISARKKAERELQRTRNLQHALFNAITESLLAIDIQGKIVAANHTAAQRLGTTVAALIDTNIRALPHAVMPEAVQNERWCKVEEVIRTKAPTRFVTKRQGRTFDSSFYPIFGDDGQVSHVTIYAQEITQQKAAECAIQEYQRKMVKAEHLASTGTLSAMVAHELAQPLTVARLSVQNALARLEHRDGLGPVVHELRDGLEGIHKTDEVVKRFREFARMTPDQSITDCQIHELTRQVVQLLQSRCAKAGLDVDIDALACLPAIRWYGRDLEQLLYIFVENALQAALERNASTLTIQGQVDPQQVKLIFADTCGGIQPEHESRIFEPFFTTQSLESNTGLGLCVAQRIVEDRGGRIQLENRPGDGVTFLLVLPMNNAT